MKKRFEGELKWINPNKLITQNRYDETEGFFLGLGVVFNDLKGLIFLEKILMEMYEKPKEGKATCHNGDYCGILVQIKKLIAGTINEFFIFLKNSTDIFEGSEFKQILARLPKEDISFWKAMIAASQDNLLSITDFLKSIIKIRNNLAFHYYQSGKALRQGYLSRFFAKWKNETNEFAYYSMGNNIETTRFYFSDAAVEESLYIMAGKKIGESVKDDPSLQIYQEQIMETIKVMSVSIALLLKNYIQSRRNSPS